MNRHVLCPACGWRVPMSGAPVHLSTEGPVRYLRCSCGQWLIVLAGEVIGIAGRPIGLSQTGRGSPT